MNHSNRLSEDELAGHAKDWVIVSLELESKLSYAYLDYAVTGELDEAAKSLPEYKKYQAIKLRKNTQKKKECDREAKYLLNHPLTNHLNQTSEYRRIQQALKARNIGPCEQSLYRNEFVHLAPDIAFELTVLRIIASALWLYGDPRYFTEDGFNASALEDVEPSARMQKAARTFLEERQTLDYQVSEEVFSELSGITSDDPETRIAVNNITKLVVQEVSLLAIKYLNLDGSPHSRFPTQCIERIFELLSVSVHAKSIQRIKRKHNSYNALTTRCLTDNALNLSGFNKVGNITITSRPKETVIKEYLEHIKNTVNHDSTITKI